jgi:hypothetical protein
MRTSKSDPQAVFFSTLMYRLLLITYPKDFQREYASSMAQVFHDCCLRAFHTRGFLGMLSLWSVTLVDYIESAFVEYTRKGVHMNTSRFIRLGGLALILGTATFLTGLLVEVMILGHGSASNPNNYYSRSIDQFLAVLPYILMPSAMLLLTIGVMGLYLRYGPRASLLGKAGLVAGTAGGVLALATCIAGGSFGLTQFLLSDHIGGWWLWDLAMVAMCLLMGGIFTCDWVTKPNRPEISATTEAINQKLVMLRSPRKMISSRLLHRWMYASGSRGHNLNYQFTILERPWR